MTESECALGARDDNELSLQRLIRRDVAKMRDAARLKSWGCDSAGNFQILAMSCHCLWHVTFVNV